ncbi:hypothetical protein FHS96_002691 [Sphingomonas zeicaulis]|uniref:hypothetical protein n=1 Tax=Sphingomonas zeicaulis TaxID=1632740 RepID=UPI003D1E46D6
MPLPALLLVMQAQAAATSPAYPEDAVLAAFKGACTSLESAAKADAAIRATGWERFTPDPASPFGELVAFGKTVPLRHEGSEYRRTVSGRPLELALSAVDNGEEGVTVGCRVYDMTADAPLSDSAVRRFGGEGFRKTDIPEVFLSYIWEPGVVARGHSKTQIGYVPQGSEVAEKLHVVGVSLMAQRINAKGSGTE